MRTLFVILFFLSFLLRGITQIHYDSLLVLNLKKEIKGMHIADNNILWFYTYHQVHKFDVLNNSDVIYPVEDDTVYQYLFNNALKNSDYETKLSHQGESLIYIVDKRNIFWFLKEKNKYVLFNHLEIDDQYASGYSKTSFVNDKKIVAGGPFGKLLTFTRLNNKIVEDSISIGDSGAIYSMDVSRSGELLSLGTGASNYLTYNLSADSLLSKVSLKNFQKYCDGHWCTQIPVKVAIFHDEQKIALMIANKVNSIIISSISGKFNPAFDYQYFNAIDFCVSNNHLFILDDENKIYIMDFNHKLVNEISSSNNRFSPYQKIIASEDGKYLIKHNQIGRIEIYERRL